MAPPLALGDIMTKQMSWPQAVALGLGAVTIVALSSYSITAAYQPLGEGEFIQRVQQNGFTTQVVDYRTARDACEHNTVDNLRYLPMFNGRAEADIAAYLSAAKETC